MRRSTVWATAITLVLSACVTTNSTPLGAMRFAPLPVDSVVVYRTADKVPGKYEEIALLNSSGATGWTNEADMIQSMRTEAAKHGANGIILDALSEPSAGAKVAAAVFNTTTERKGKAIAIRVLPKEQ